MPKYSRKRRHSSSRKKRTLTKRVKRVERLVRRNKPELKYSDVSATNQQFSQSFAGTSIIDCLANISQNVADNNNRIGDRIYVRNVVFRLAVYDTTYTPFMFRIIGLRVLHNSEGLITTTSLGNIFMESSYSGTVNSVNAPYDFDNKNNIKVFYDKVHTINPSSNLNGINTSMVQGKHYTMKFRINKQVEFFHGGSVPIMNGLYFLLISADAASASQICHYVVRVHYTDA